jgi:ornithine decarboxylase
MGVRRFIVDNRNDLDVLLKELKEKDRVELFLRLRMKERTIRTERHYVYGMYSAEVNRLVNELRGDDRIEKLGVHFHRKTMNIGEWDLKSEMAEILDEETLRSIDTLDIGGGIPIEYKNYNGDDLLPSIMKRISELRTWLNKEYDVKLMAEPGRFIAGPCISLDAEIIGINGNTILINCSVFNSAMDTIVANIKLKVEGELEKGTPYLIKGCIPDSEDIFRYRVYLKEPEVGGRIRFLNAGAYTYTTNFCDLDTLEYQIVE